MISERKSGILLHPSSLPGKFGIGTFGKEAYDFVDFLSGANQRLWQILPLNHTGDGSCPYASISAFAGSPLLINLEKLQEEGLLTDHDLVKAKGLNDDTTEYNIVRKHKIPILKKAFENSKKINDRKEYKKFEAFCEKEKCWLDDFSLFIELKTYFSKVSWHCWDADIKLRKSSAIENYKKRLHDQIEFQKFMQYIFYKQWLQLKKYTNSKGIKIIGDIPIFVSYDSADVWAHPEIFCLGRNKLPKEVSGVPPDYFSKTGQLWGNPQYNWKALKQQDYKWWVDRFRKEMQTTDIIRLDHFRGFDRYWVVPYGDKNAVNGKWKKGPGEDLFNVLEKTFGKLPVIAEDLGYITPSVIKLRDKFGFAGMKVLQFLFGKEDIKNKRHLNFPVNSVVYTGTHDNDTTIGWFEKLDEDNKELIRQQMKSDEKLISWSLIGHAWSSESVFAVVPMQDILSLGSAYRMNIPGTNEGDWEWRYHKKQLTPKIADHLKNITKKYKR
jgi:4-alpha-glucanotransferase